MSFNIGVKKQWNLRQETMKDEMMVKYKGILSSKAIYICEMGVEDTVSSQ